MAILFPGPTPVVTETTPGLAPAGAGGVPGGSAGSIQVHNGEANPGLEDVPGLVWDSDGEKLDVPGDINLDDGGTYTTTLQLVTPTANRVISYPDATGTIGLVAGIPGQFVYNNSGAYGGVSTMTFDGTSVTLAGRLINSYTSLASSPAKVFTGTWFTGGTGTTTKPHFLIEPAGVTSTGWSTSGTGLGVNAATGFTGNLLDLQVNGVSQARITNTGSLLLGSNSAPAVRTDTTGVTGADQITNIISLTQAEYDAIVTPDPATFYVITA